MDKKLYYSARETHKTNQMEENNTKGFMIFGFYCSFYVKLMKDFILLKLLSPMKSRGTLMIITFLNNDLSQGKI
jgi:hypothetical protein